MIWLAGLSVTIVLVGSWILDARDRRKHARGE